MCKEDIRIMRNTRYKFFASGTVGNTLTKLAPRNADRVAIICSVNGFSQVYTQSQTGTIDQTTGAVNVTVQTQANMGMRFGYMDGTTFVPLAVCTNEERSKIVHVRDAGKAVTEEIWALNINSTVFEADLVSVEFEDELGDV